MPIIDYPEPKNLRQLRRFLEMTSWYRKFLPDFATLAEPLTRLTKKDQHYDWLVQQQDAFDRTKALIATTLLLQRPDFDQQFIVQTDANDTGIGAVPTQNIDGQEHVLEFVAAF